MNLSPVISAITTIVSSLPKINFSLDFRFFQSAVSWKIFSLEIDLNSQITLATIVFSLIKNTSGLKIYFRIWPRSRFQI